MVVVVGGGISGLSAAYELQRRGVEYQLLEGSTRWGGSLQTEVVNGFTIDGGADSLLTQKPAAIELCQELGLGRRLIPTGTPRTAFILRNGVLHPLPEGSVLGVPLGSMAGTQLLSPQGQTRLAAEIAIPRAESGADESIGAFFKRRFGEEAVDYIAEPLLAGIHAGDVEKLSVRALFPRLVEAEARHGSVIKGLRAMAAARGGPASRDGLFRSLPGGLGELVTALTARLDPTRLHRGAPVVGLARTNRFVVRLADGQSLTADHVLLTTPAPVTAALVESLDEELAGLCGSILYASTATVALGYPQETLGRPLNGTGFVVPRAEREVRLMAASWVSTKWPGRSPPGQALLRGFLGGVRDPDVLTASDDELIELTHRDFRDLLGLRSEPSLRRVYRWVQATPQHDVGHLERVEAVERCVARHPGLRLTGAGFHGVGIPECVANGRAAGRGAAEAMTTR